MELRSLTTRTLDRADRDRRAARAARHAGCADSGGASSISPPVSGRPTRRRAQPVALVVHPEAARLAAPASPLGCSLSADLDARRLAVAPSSRDRRHARSKPSSNAASRDDSRSCWACATAVLRSRRPCRSCVSGERTGCCCSRCTRSTQAATTASTYDEVFRQLSMLRFVPSLRVVAPYYDHPAYIEALAESVREAMASRPRPPEKVIISFHGIPQSFVDSGDPYASHCEATARSLAARAGWEEGHLPAFLPVARRPRAMVASVHG